MGEAFVYEYVMILDNADLQNRDCFYEIWLGQRLTCLPLL